ncbi:MAG: asparaginase [Bdellovibrionales bacterium]|nr:asparaginase [Bdellovibrionales bacterium]
MKVKFFTTGGTIDKIYFDELSKFEVGDSYVEHVLQQAQIAFEYSIEEILRKDSLDITAEERQVIFERVRDAKEDRIVITHGTDTMAETGQVLQSIPGKTIVLTGALQPARFHESDAAFNIGMAVAAVQSLDAGVYLAINGRIFNPATTKKNRDANRFEAI